MICAIVGNEHMLSFGAALAPLVRPPAFLKLRRLTSPCWPHRYIRTFCSSKIRCYVGVKRMLRTTTKATCSSCCNLPIAFLIVTLMVFSVAATATATQPPRPPSLPSEETLSNIPQMLSGECASPTDCKKARIQHPKSRKAESCTIKCVTTCIRGGAGSPGEGPLNARRPLVVFKEGFRSRQYCLVECSDICNLIKDGEDGQPSSEK